MFVQSKLAPGLSSEAASRRRKRFGEGGRARQGANASSLKKLWGTGLQLPDPK